MGMRNLGPNLTYYRLKAGLSMSDLARVSGVVLANIVRYEHGTVREPKRETLEKLAAALGVPAATLVDEPPPELFPPATPPIARAVEGWPTAATDERLARIERAIADLTELAGRQGRSAPAGRLFPRDARVVRLLGRAGADPSGGETWLELQAADDQAVMFAIGDCLAPAIEDGDWLLVDLERTPKLYEYVVVAVHGEIHLKQVIDRSATGLALTSKRGDLMLPEEGAELLGVVVKIGKEKPPQSMNLSKSSGRAARPSRRRPNGAAEADSQPTLPPPWASRLPNGADDD